MPGRGALGWRVAGPRTESRWPRWRRTDAGARHPGWAAKSHELRAADVQVLEAELGSLGQIHDRAPLHQLGRLITTLQPGSDLQRGLLRHTVSVLLDLLHGWFHLSRF